MPTLAELLLAVLGPEPLTREQRQLVISTHYCESDTFLHFAAGWNA